MKRQAEVVENPAIGGRPSTNQILVGIYSKFTVILLIQGVNCSKHY